MDDKQKYKTCRLCANKGMKSDFWGKKEQKLREKVFRKKFFRKKSHLF